MYKWGVLCICVCVCVWVCMCMYHNLSCCTNEHTDNILTVHISTYKQQSDQKRETTIDSYLHPKEKKAKASGRRTRLAMPLDQDGPSRSSASRWTGRAQPPASVISLPTVACTDPLHTRRQGHRGQRSKGTGERSCSTWTVHATWFPQQECSTPSTRS